MHVNFTSFCRLRTFTLATAVLYSQAYSVRVKAALMCLYYRTLNGKLAVGFLVICGFTALQLVSRVIESHPQKYTNIELQQVGAAGNFPKLHPGISLGTAVCPQSRRPHPERIVHQQNWQRQKTDT